MMSILKPVVYITVADKSSSYTTPKQKNVCMVLAGTAFMHSNIKEEKVQEHNNYV